MPKTFYTLEEQGRFGFWELGLQKPQCDNLWTFQGTEGDTLAILSLLGPILDRVSDLLSDVHLGTRYHGQGPACSFWLWAWAKCCPLIISLNFERTPSLPQSTGKGLDAFSTQQVMYILSLDRGILWQANSPLIFWVQAEHWHSSLAILTLRNTLVQIFLVLNTTETTPTEELSASFWGYKNSSQKWRRHLY